jgi:hypothetical protein
VICQSDVSRPRTFIYVEVYFVSFLNIVTCLLEVVIAEREETAVTRQWLYKYVSRVTSSRDHGMLHKYCNSDGSVAKKDSGSKPQGAWRQDEVIG